MQISEQSVINRHSLSLTGNQLKILACISMFADHAVKAWYVHGMTYTLLSSVLGRIAFPIYCFFITEGFFHTRNSRKYILRILLFGVLSEIQYDIIFYKTAWYPKNQNVLFILACGLLMFVCLSYVESFRSMHIALSWVLRLFIVAGFATAAHYLFLDYRERGILCMAVFYFLRGQQPTSVPALWACLPLNMRHFSNPGSFLSAFPLHFYHGERGAANLKYFFYWFYPLHLLFLLAIQHFVLHVR